MAHEDTEEIKCPYCDIGFGDSWEYQGSDGATIDCDCGKTFTLSVSFDVTYSTYKKNCENSKHDYGEPEYYFLDQKVCDERNRIKFCDKSDWKPHRTITRYCRNCDTYDYQS